MGVSIDRAEDPREDLKWKTIPRFELEPEASWAETGKGECSEVLG
jgi:hypothetical protein